MQREYAGQFEFESAGAARQERGGGTSKKRKSTAKGDKKKLGKRPVGGEEERGGPTGRWPPEVPSEDPRLVPSVEPKSPARSLSPLEPGYQTIPNSSRPQPAAQQPGIYYIHIHCIYVCLHLDHNIICKWL